MQDCKVAIKLEKKRSRFRGDRGYLQNEINILTRICHHPNIVTLLGYMATNDQRQLGLVMEMMYGDMRSHIEHTKVELRQAKDDINHGWKSILSDCKTDCVWNGSYSKRFKRLIVNEIFCSEKYELLYLISVILVIHRKSKPCSS